MIIKKEGKKEKGNRTEPQKANEVKPGCGRSPLPSALCTNKRTDGTQSLLVAEAALPLGSGFTKINYTDAISKLLLRVRVCV